MSAVLVAVFNEYQAAERVRIALVRDGVPTDRVELAECVCNGAATITVHTRGAMETARATRILAGASPLQLLSHDLPDQTLKSVAARRWRPGIFGFRVTSTDLLIGALALCLLIAGYLVAKQASGEVGLRVMPSGLRLNQTQEIEPDQTQPVLRSCFPAKDIRTVIAHYFDMYLVPG